MRRFALGVSIAASLGAAAIHFALGPHHVEELGTLGLGFYLAAILQVVFAAALVAARDRSDGAYGAIVRAGVGFNAAILTAWAFSRLVGLPAGPEPWVPEAVGVTDSISGALEVLVVVLGVALLRDSPVPSGRPADRAGRAMSLSMGPAIGLIAVATAFALLSPEGVAGHGDDGHPHGPSDAHALAPSGMASDANARTEAGPEPAVAPEPGESEPPPEPEVDAPPGESHGHPDGNDAAPHSH